MHTKNGSFGPCHGPRPKLGVMRCNYFSKYIICFSKHMDVICYGMDYFVLLLTSAECYDVFVCYVHGKGIYMNRSGRLFGLICSNFNKTYNFCYSLYQFFGGNYLNLDLSYFLLVYIGDIGLGLCAPRPGGELV